MSKSAAAPSGTLTAAIKRVRIARHIGRGAAAYAERRFLSALRRWQIAHLAGSNEAAFRIAELYVKGEGVQRNLAEAVKWYREAASHGHADAQFRLGLILLNGALGGGAAKWHSAATAHDAHLAQKNAHALFPSGFEVRSDPVECLRWLEEASQNGVREADSVIGSIYLEGQVRPRDFAAARQRLQLSADAGVASAQFRLGDMLFRGLGQPSNPAAAADWYERAAAQGHPRAAVAIATILMTGQGRPRDKDRAGADHETAAQADDPQGLYQAGLYEA